MGLEMIPQAPKSQTFQLGTSWYYCSEMFISQQFPGSPAYPAAEQRRDLFLIAFVDSNGWVEEKNTAGTRVSLYPCGVAAVCVYF